MVRIVLNTFNFRIFSLLLEEAVFMKNMGEPLRVKGKRDLVIS